MSFISKIRSFFDDIGITRTSKIYTPFTLFCAFFAIYFNADLLGKIFLAPEDRWPETLAALEILKNKNEKIWFDFAIKVLKYSIVAVAIYGLGQIIASFIWALSNLANAFITAKAEKHSFVDINEYIKSKKELISLKKEVLEISENHRNEQIKTLEETKRYQKELADTSNKLKDKELELYRFKTLYENQKSETKNITNFLSGFNSIIDPNKDQYIKDNITTFKNQNTSSRLDDRLKDIILTTQYISDNHCIIRIPIYDTSFSFGIFAGILVRHFKAQIEINDRDISIYFQTIDFEEIKALTE